VTIRPDRARCTACGATHVMLDAGLLPRRAYTTELIGQALVAAARENGHRPIASSLALHPHVALREFHVDMVICGRSTVSWTQLRRSG
jgi:hypothetical protein